jgi:hypothetical protein
VTELCRRIRLMWSSFLAAVGGRDFLSNNRFDAAKSPVLSALSRLQDDSLSWRDIPEGNEIRMRMAELTLTLHGQDCG